MVKVVKITDETHEDLQRIQKILVHRGTKILPPAFRWIAEKTKEPTTYKTIIAIAVTFLRDFMEKIEEAHSKAEEEMKKENQTK